MNQRTPLYQSANLDIWLDQAGGYLDLDWKGPQTLESVQRGCETILEHLIAQRLTKVLNDNTNVVGSWEEASHWVAVDFLPRAKRAGLSTLAWIQSPSRGSRHAANATAMDAGRDDLIHLFDDRKSAELWLRQTAASR